MKVYRRCTKCGKSKPITCFNMRRYQLMISYRSCCRTCDAIRKVAYRQALKQRALLAYGGKCACCLASDIEFLTIDHIKGGGQQHRRMIHCKPGDQFYRWLYEHKYFAGYQVLCFNCNSAKGFYGYCPHNKAQDMIEPTSERPVERTNVRTTN